MSRGPQTSPAVQREIRRLLHRGYGKAQIERELRRMHLDEENTLFPAGTEPPSKSTIDRFVDRFRRRDVSGDWSFLMATPEQRRFVPEVLTEVFSSTNGQVWLTVDQAEWITNLRSAYPEMPAGWAYTFANSYLEAINEKQGTGLIDLALGYQPWRRIPEQEALADGDSGKSAAGESESAEAIYEEFLTWCISRVDDWGPEAESLVLTETAMESDAVSAENSLDVANA